MTMTYATLTGAKTVPGSIMSWVNYAKLDIEQVLEEAQAVIFQRLRVREMRNLDSSIPVAPGDFQKPLPARVLEARRLRSTDNLDYALVSETALLDARVYDASGTLVAGTPAAFAVFDEMLQFDQKFSAATTLLLLCFKSPALLSAQNPANFLTSRFPHLVRTACLAQAADFMKDDSEYAKHMQRLYDQIDAGNAESDLGMSAATYSTTMV
jgi:hypothetical protein